MGGTKSEGDAHSTAASEPAAGGPTAYDPRRRLRLRFFASLVLIGLLVGLLIGRLVDPGPVRLEAVQALADGLQLRFGRQAEFQHQDIDGAFGMLLMAEGQAQQGQLNVEGMPVRWHIQPTERGLLVHFVAVRALQVEVQDDALDGGWTLVLRVSPATPDGP